MSDEVVDTSIVTPVRSPGFLALLLGGPAVLGLAARLAARFGPSEAVPAGQARRRGALRACPRAARARPRFRHCRGQCRQDPGSEWRPLHSRHGPLGRPRAGAPGALRRPRRGRHGAAAAGARDRHRGAARLGRGGRAAGRDRQLCAAARRADRPPAVRHFRSEPADVHGSHPLDLRPDLPQPERRCRSPGAGHPGRRAHAGLAGGRDRPAARDAESMATT